MDAKMIEMNNLRVLNDYLNQTIDALARQPRVGQPGLGFSPFSPVAGTPAALGTDTVYGPWYAAMGHTSFGAFPGFPAYAAGLGGVDPLLAQRTFGQPGLGQPTYGQSFVGQPTYGQPAFGQPAFGPSTFAPIGYGPSTFAPLGYGQAGYGAQPWSPIAEAQRQAHVNQALAAKTSVLEAMCRAAGIPC
jgi:hypothetical protein